MSLEQEFSVLDARSWGKGESNLGNAFLAQLMTEELMVFKGVAASLPEGFQGTSPTGPHALCSSVPH